MYMVVAPTREAPVGIFNWPTGSTNTEKAASPSENATALPLPDRGAAAGAKPSGRQLRVQPLMRPTTDC